MKNSNSNKKLIAIWLILQLVCVSRIVAPIFAGSETTGEPIGITVLTIFVFSAISLFVENVLHEAGHLFFGWIMGFRFLSFGFKDYRIVKKNKRISFKRYHIARPTGHFEMSPEKLDSSKMAYCLYYLGGAFVNTLSAFVCFLLCKTMESVEISRYFYVAGFMACIVGIRNAVPIQTARVNNDGFIVWHLRKNKRAEKALGAMVITNAYRLNGERLKDIPQNWFHLPDREEMMNPIIANSGVLFCERLMDEGRFEEAELIIYDILRHDNSLMEYQKALLRCNEISCMILRGAARDSIDEMMTDIIIRYLNMEALDPAILRTKYAYTKCILKDRDRARLIKDQYMRIKGEYPYPLGGEDEIMRLLDQIPEETV